MVAIFLLNYKIIFFSNIRSRSILLEMYSIKEKGDLSQSEEGWAGCLLNDPRTFQIDWDLSRYFRFMFYEWKGA